METSYSTQNLWDLPVSHPLVQSYYQIVERILAPTYRRINCAHLEPWQAEVLHAAYCELMNIALHPYVSVAHPLMSPCPYCGAMPHPLHCTYYLVRMHDPKWPRYAFNIGEGPEWDACFVETTRRMGAMGVQMVDEPWVPSSGYTFEVAMMMHQVPIDLWLIAPHAYAPTSEHDDTCVHCQHRPLGDYLQYRHNRRYFMVHHMLGF